jgi:TolB-like protein
MTEPPTTGPSEPETSPPQTPAAAPELPWLQGIWARLRHHKVMHWTLAYAAAAYTLLHGAQMIGEALSWPHVIVRVLSLVLILGVPVTVLLAWYHGHKAQHRISGPELAMLTVLLFIAGTLLWALSGSKAEHTEKTVTTTGVITDTTSAKSTAPVAPRTAVAVLPFANLTGDATKEYLGDGMAEELINTLSKVQGLKVPARTSTFAYKGRNTDIRRIANDLGVGTILEGSVRAAGKRIRITAQLINAQDGLHLWSESYDEEFTDIFKLQDKLATEITTALQPNLLAAAEVAVTQGPPTRDVEAYTLYLQGVSLVQRRSEQNAAKAIEYFQQALARDPKFARAYAWIAQAHMSWSTLSRPAEHHAAAERAARQALALDPNLATGHLALAGVNSARGQYLEMEVHRRAAVSLAPNDGHIRAISAILLPGKGHLKQGLEEAGKAYALAPANPMVVALLAYQHAGAGHDLGAAKYADAAVDLGYPKESFPLPATRELIALHAKRYADAAEIVTKTVDVRDPDPARTVEVARLAYAALADPGRRNTALAAGARLYPNSGTAAAAGATHTDVWLCLKSSYYYALMAAHDVAYGLANQCLDGRAPGEVSAYPNANAPFTWFIPELRTFRQDPRFQALATRVGWMEYWQQYGPPDDCDLKNGKLTCH